MFANKIKLTEEYIDLIVKKRKEHELTAYQLSEKLGKNKSWIPNIENCRTKNISKEDFLLIFSDFAKEENLETEKYIIKHLHPNALIELEDNTQIPCYHLQGSLEVYPPKFIAPSINEMKKRLDYYTSEKSKLYSVDLLSLETNINKIREIIIDEFSQLEHKERQNIIDSLSTMYSNYNGQFKYTQMLYNVSAFRGDPTEEFGEKIGNKYLQDIEVICNKYHSTITLAYATSTINAYFESNPTSSYSLFKDINKYTENDYTEFYGIFLEIEVFIYNAFLYINATLKESQINNTAHPIDYDKIFQSIIYLYSEFIRLTQLDYSFEITIPNSSATEEDISKIQLSINDITINIKKRFHLKYNDSL